MNEPGYKVGDRIEFTRDVDMGNGCIVPVGIVMYVTNSNPIEVGLWNPQYGKVSVFSENIKYSPLPPPVIDPEKEKAKKEGVIKVRALTLVGEMLSLYPDDPYVSDAVTAFLDYYEQSECYHG